MKKIALLVSLLLTIVANTQVKEQHYRVDATYFFGNILKHNPDISHLIRSHPSGAIFGFNKKTFGHREWERLHHYPDVGFSFIYQNMHNSTLGKHYGLYAHYNFYFLKRKMLFRIAQGLSYNTNPYDAQTNFRNIAYGTHVLSSTYALFNYKEDAIIDKIGVQVGLGIVHYSNANFRAPNTSTNTIFANFGITYEFDSEVPEYAEREENILQYSEPVTLSLLSRFGVNESDIVGSGQYPFVVLGAMVDKRLNKKSTIQLGSELFFSEALEIYIDYRASGEFEDGVTGDEDSKRASIFIGHELRLGKFAIPIQFGYYVYYPFDFEGTTYNRVALKYYTNPNIFLATSVRSHAAKAEAVEFSLGYRF